MRIIISLLALLIGLLTAREFVGRSNERALAPLLPEAAEQDTVALNNPSAPAVAMSQCEQTWDPATHMTKEEWSQACRRVDDDRQLP